MSDFDALSVFKAVSVIFAIASMATGSRSIIDPIGFSKQYGLPIRTYSWKDAPVSSIDSNSAEENQRNSALAMSYASLMGVRQLATGIIVLSFPYQDKWIEIATILAIIGVIVAGTDGVYIAKGGSVSSGLMHAVPGSLIAALAALIIYSGA